MPRLNLQGATVILRNNHIKSHSLPLQSSQPWHDTMPICIECSYPVSHLYSTYSRADDRSLGKGVRLTQCPRCKRFADKYVEYDYVVVFIDLVLIKPQVCWRYELSLVEYVTVLLSSFPGVSPSSLQSARKR